MSEHMDATLEANTEYAKHSYQILKIILCFLSTNYYDSGYNAYINIRFVSLKRINIVIKMHDNLFIHFDLFL